MLTIYPKALVLIIFMAGLAACHPSEPWTSNNPEFALRAFLNALRAGDSETVAEFLSDDAHDLLANARVEPQATLGESETTTDPMAELYRVWTPSALEIERLETADSDDSTATVIIHTVYGIQRPVSMRRSDGRWTIDLGSLDLHPIPEGSQLP